MITFTVNIDETLIKGDVNEAVGKLIRTVAFVVEAEIKKLMTLPKHGRRYRRGTRSHTASAPGEAPAVDTGFLINTIKTTIKSDTEAVIEIPAEYAEGLEFGTSRVEARPFARPAISGVLKRFSRGGGILASARE
jgi:hypothetical protein